MGELIPVYSKQVNKMGRIYRSTLFCGRTKTWERQESNQVPKSWSPKQKRNEPIFQFSPAPSTLPQNSCFHKNGQIWFIRRRRGEEDSVRVFLEMEVGYLFIYIYYLTLPLIILFQSSYLPTPPFFFPSNVCACLDYMQVAPCWDICEARSSLWFQESASGRPVLLPVSS